ncbi:MAG: PorT family protein [Prevotella sp.]|nr:PorT family protein [Prevotella sp.]
MRCNILFYFFALLPLSVFAQVGEHRSELAVGVSGGCILSEIGFTPEVNQYQHSGLTGGITVRYTSEKYFKSICAIVAELNYAQIGWKEKILDSDDLLVINSVTGQAEAYQRDMAYIQLPVLARLGWGRERKGMQFFFQAGPQLGMFLNEHTKKNYNVTERPLGVTAQDSMAVENKFDFGITAGLGLEYSHPKVGHFMLEGRYYYGLGDIYGNSKRDYFARSNILNITIKLTYLFDISRTKNSKIK